MAGGKKRGLQLSVGDRLERDKREESKRQKLERRKERKRQEEEELDVLDENPPPPPRQGRSAFVRAQKAVEQELKRCLLKPNPPTLYEQRCSNCGWKLSMFLTEMDERDFTCSNCGAVVERSFISPETETPGLIRTFKNKESEVPTIVSATKSKPYFRGVHCQQCLTAVLGQNPAVPEYIVRILTLYSCGVAFKRRDPETGDEYVETLLLEESDNPDRWGPKSFAAILKKLRLPTKWAKSWIQLRRRCGLKPWRVPFHRVAYPGEPAKEKRVREPLLDAQGQPVLDENGEVVLKPKPPPRVAHLRGMFLCRLKLLFSRVSEAFDHVIAGREGDLGRINIINMNYVLIQLVRLEAGEDAFEECAKFFPLINSSEQPRKNNERWKLIVEWNSRHSVGSFLCPETKQFLYIPAGFWRFLPITANDIINHFTFFY